jgi:hypothetical protein
MVTAAESTVLAPAGATKEPTINPMIASTARTRVTANHLDMPHNLQKSAEMTRRRATQSALMACEAKRQIRPARPDTARPLTMGCACLRLAIRAAHWPRAITCGPRKRKILPLSAHQADAADASKRASMTAHLGARPPLHCAAISSITLLSRFKSAILWRISATWFSVSSLTCAQVSACPSTRRRRPRISSRLKSSSRSA